MHVNNEVNLFFPNDFSQGQAKHLRSLLPLLEEVLNAMNLPTTQMVTIANLGCSSGENTLVVANNIVNFMTHKYKFKFIAVPEFQVFFSDFPYIYLTTSTHSSNSNAYIEQFKSDLEAFLQARFREMKCGGCMFLVFLGEELQVELGSSLTPIFNKLGTI